MLHYASGTPKNDAFQAIENQLCSHRLLSMYHDYQPDVFRWLNDVRSSESGSDRKASKSSANSRASSMGNADVLLMVVTVSVARPSVRSASILMFCSCALDARTPGNR